MTRKQRDDLVREYRRLCQQAYDRNPCAVQDQQGYALGKMIANARKAAFDDARNAIKFANLPPGQHVSWYEDRYLESVTLAEKGKA
jgi:hypothetical protein